ncbi:rhodanese domain-containing protein CG4456 isoform X2 [Anabrus simplex]|uniref:rhodanese domain-containing protein CG4456 isoform X2 n=1 Tax=Anabrus simplex TaxID=316456 RepID=UPI0035A34D82
MLRTFCKVVIPLSVRVRNLDFQSVIVRGIVRRENGNVHHQLVQVLNQQEGRKMCTAITDEMHLSYEDIVKLKECEDVIIIDVRNPNELEESGKIEGSINIPLKELRFALEYLSIEEFQYKYGIPRPKLDAPLIFHCRSGKRSLQALQTALDLSYKKRRMDIRELLEFP